jgi:membrane associated rhomboid family serine protease
MLQFAPVSRNIVFICVAVFIIQLITRGQATLYLELHPINSPNFRPYQLFSYMWAHGDFSHIFFNMMMLTFAAPALEMVWGQQRILLFYLATGIGAALIYGAIEYFLHPFDGRPMIGASGAIYGLLVGMALTMPDRELNMMFLPSIKAKYLVLILFATSFFFGSSNTAHAAHFGGALVGFLMIKIFRF